LRSKLLSLGLLPETFVQKWFAGICIHHMPYHLLVHFLDRFFSEGNRYLFQFFLAFFEEFEADLMRFKSNPEGQPTHSFRNSYRAAFAKGSGGSLARTFRAGDQAARFAPAAL